MSKNIEDIEFTIFDTETTGLEPESGDRIVEIAAIRFKGSQRIAVFQSLVNPNRPIAEAAFQVNRISQEMLKDAADSQAVLLKFLDFIQGSCLASYNAAFDLAFLNSELRLLGKNLAQDIAAVDILRMARRLMPALERYALWFVAEKLGLEAKQEHRALSDAELAFEVFNRLSEILKAKNISDFLIFLGLFGVNSNLPADINNQKIAKIQEAIDLGVKIRIRYLSRASAAVSEREVLPKEVRRQESRSYLVGHCYLRNEERSFRIDGILHLEIV